MLLDRFGQSNKFWQKSLKNFGTSKLEYSEGPLGDVLRTSWGRPEFTSHGRLLNVRLERPLNVISGRAQHVRLGRPKDVWSGHLQDGPIGSLGVVLGTLEGDIVGTSWEPIFAGWDDLDYDAIEFPLRGKDFSKIEEKKNIWINVLGYESRLTFFRFTFRIKNLRIQ